jgi:transposase
LRVSLARLRASDAMELLADRGVDATWRRSIAEALAVIELLDERSAPLERELRQAARDDRRVVLVETIPGVGDLLGVSEDLCRHERTGASCLRERTAGSSWRSWRGCRH